MPEPEMAAASAHSSSSKDRNSQPWERLRDPETDKPLESENAHTAFLLYCHMGQGRSLAALHEELTKRKLNGLITKCPTRKTINYWSATYHWQERKAAWDAEQLRKEHEEYEALRRKVKDERIQALRLVRSRALQIIAKIDPEHYTDPSTGESGPMNTMQAVDVLPQVTNALQMAVKELRAEFDDEPTHRFKGEMDWRREAQTSGIDDVDNLFEQMVKAAMDRTSQGGSLGGSAEAAGRAA